MNGVYQQYVDNYANENEADMYFLGKRSRERLEGVHPDLVAVVERAIELTDVDFTVLEGLRSEERQKELYDKGASKTLNSRHLTGHAVDLGAWVGGTVRWDWPLYHKIAEAVKKAAAELGVKIVWGGDWQTFKDGPHFELCWTKYPKSEQFMGCPAKIKIKRKVIDWDWS